MARKSVIITCAITGSLHTPSMSPYLPITPDQIVAESVAAAEAGASIIHLHARDPKDGRPWADPDLFMQFLPRIKQQHQRGAQHHQRWRARHDARSASRRCDLPPWLPVELAAAVRSRRPRSRPRNVVRRQP